MVEGAQARQVDLRMPDRDSGVGSEREPSREIFENTATRERRQNSFFIPDSDEEVLWMEYLACILFAINTLRLMAASC